MANKEDIKKGTIVYYSRILPPVGIYDVCELKVRTVGDDYFVGVDKHDKRAYLFSYKRLDDIVFFDRNMCLEKVINAENDAPKISNERDYEEY